MIQKCAHDNFSHASRLSAATGTTVRWRHKPRPTAGKHRRHREPAAAGGAAAYLSGWGAASKAGRRPYISDSGWTKSEFRRSTVQGRSGGMRCACCSAAILAARGSACRLEAPTWSRPESALVLGMGGSSCSTCRGSRGMPEPAWLQIFTGVRGLDKLCRRLRICLQDELSVMGDTRTVWTAVGEHINMRN